MRRRLIVFLSLAMIGNLWLMPKVLAQQTPENIKVRVAIARQVDQIEVQVLGPFRLFDEVSKKDVDVLERLPKTQVRLLPKGFFIYGKNYPYQRLTIIPRKDHHLRINQRPFRGSVTLIRTPEQKILAVNTIDLEDYIKGVLFHEVSHRWPIEAIKAQAVATRTYAIFSLNKNKDFDVTNDIYSQVYGGKGSERYRTGLAVERTSYEVLTYNGRILPAYFHACCAGMTEDAQVLWDVNTPPLKGVPCLFCKDAPHMNWKRNLRLGDIQDALNQKGHKIGLIKDIQVVENTRSNRALKIKITGRAGETLLLKATDFREILGPNVIKSNMYTIEMKGYYVDFIGHGWGHGVGMCQWGARGMAMQGFSYQQILNYYYPGSMIVDDHNVLRLL